MCERNSSKLGYFPRLLIHRAIMYIERIPSLILLSHIHFSLLGQKYLLSEFYMPGTAVGTHRKQVTCSLLLYSVGGREIINKSVISQSVKFWGKVSYTNVKEDNWEPRWRHLLYNGGQDKALLWTHELRSSAEKQSPLWRFWSVSCRYNR